jgi:hypothetical protein
MPRGLRVRKVALAQIILILVHYESTAKEILGPNIGN